MGSWLGWKNNKGGETKCFCQILQKLYHFKTFLCLKAEIDQYEAGISYIVGCMDGMGPALENLFPEHCQILCYHIK